MTDSLSDDELQRLLDPKRPSGRVSMMHPLEVFVTRAWLEEVCRESLRRMAENRVTTQETPKQARSAQRAYQQRVDFLSWLKTQPEEVYIALYPMAEDGLSDEDFEDFLNDSDFPTPF